VAASSAAGSELDLRPCRVELLDGTKVEGHLAVQFNMPAHLIVYSPRLATVRSFLREHVHAVTVNGRRVEFNPRRALTDADRKLLGQVEWPNEPPATGYKPPYTTETWEAPKRLLVWAKPGSSGRFGDPESWLENGEPMKSLTRTDVWSGPAWLRSKAVASLDPETDILIPSADGSYQVAGSGGAYMARHITVESNAFLNNRIRGAYGSLWVSPAGRIDGGGHASLRGAKHTFFVNGARRNPAEPVDWKSIEAKRFARKWVVRKDASDVSVELIGTIGSGDETHVIRGRAVVSENSTILIGPRCCQTVRRDGTLVLTSGAVLAKNSNQLHKQDMMIIGELLAGTPERPLRSDCYIGISFKDHEALFAGKMWTEVGRRVDFRGFEVVPTGTIRVHSADPAKARLVFCCHQQDGAGDSGDLPNPKQEPERWAAYENLPRRINLVFWKGAELQFDGVVFRDIEKGGIRLEDLSMKDSWKHVVYGENNAGPPEELLVQYQPTMEGRGAYSFPLETAAKGERFTAHGLFTKNPGTPIIEIPDGCYPKGMTVQVKITSEINELQIRYTLDGTEPSPNSKLYEEPFAVDEDVVVKAAAFRDGTKYGDTARAEFRFVAPDEVETIASVQAGATAPGLAYTYYEGTWKEVPDFSDLEPARTGVVSALDPQAVKDRKEGAALVFEGFLDVPEAGVYMMEVSTAKKDICHVHIGGRHLIANDEDRLESSVCVGLQAGKHPLRVVFIDLGWKERVRLSLRRIESFRKEEVTADMLSH
jgi:hypothetical protein